MSIDNVERSDWSERKFQDFWSAPQADHPRSNLHDNVVGRWPGGIVIEGREAYNDQLRAMLALTPDLRLEILDHARNGDVAFLRWRSSGTGPLGPFEMDGMDMVRLKDGKEIEIIAYFDAELYRRFIGSPVPGAKW